MMLPVIVLDDRHLDLEPYRHIGGMDLHMKTTLNIDDTVMAELKRESARTGKTMGELVETALRLLFQRWSAPRDLPPLPGFHGGIPTVDPADRNALYEILDEDRRRRLYSVDDEDGGDDPQNPG